ncbi:hypothetical protein F0562_017682 [Nyssa sinensis]|uniref:Uncharacterized protein n=1 Tax=Nyssa sinensis TaxID=561372 RepID=A0A5J4ZH67_9ASTE|nr:hypothetical protein F0562_017682 [Nyssa sinensis]
MCKISLLKPIQHIFAGIPLSQNTLCTGTNFYRIIWLKFASFSISMNESSTNGARIKLEYEVKKLLFVELVFVKL